MIAFVDVSCNPWPDLCLAVGDGEKHAPLCGQRGAGLVFVDKAQHVTCPGCRAVLDTLAPREKAGRA